MVVYADSYCNIRINYVYKDGTPARDAYVATYRKGDPVKLTVTNPNIDGFVPMTAAEGGVSAATTEFDIASLNDNRTETVYYIAGLTHYRALYYKQNLYDDLYTRDNTLPASLTDRYGETGSNPTDLEDVQFEGFTNLFHEPDAIAADGSTVFRVYYDRNYYSVKFDLGAHGYGLDPVYAKYQSVYHISDPKRMGYTFAGWLRTDKDSSKGEYIHSSAKHQKSNRSGDTRWKFIDENGDELLDSKGNPIFDEHGNPTAGHEDIDLDDYYFKFNEDTIPAHDTYYKAMWKRGNTSYSVVYWVQNPDGQDLTEEQLRACADISEARTLISSNYSVVAAKDVTDVPSGTEINLDTVIKNADNEDVQIKNFFGFDLRPQAVDEVDGQMVPRVDSSGYPLSDTNERIDFPAISEAKSAELVGKSKYYNYNAAISALQFSDFSGEETNEYIKVMGDGTTRINVYYDRKDFTMKFYYARQQLDSNNKPINGKYQLTSGSKKFSAYDYATDNKTHLEALTMTHGTLTGAWRSSSNLPHIKDIYKNKTQNPAGLELEEKYDNYTDGYRYYYYEITAKYDSFLTGKWLLDPFNEVKQTSTKTVYPGSWAVEYGTNYYYSHTNINNFTIKGVYEKLSDELMFRDDCDNYLELHYLLSWTYTDTSGWNGSLDALMHFTYQNYVEMLPNEIDLMTHDADGSGSVDGPQAVIDAGIYEDVYVRQNGTYARVNPDEPFVYNASAKYYGLTSYNNIETIDSGSQYARSKTESARNIEVRVNQTSSDLTGFKLENYRKFTGNETDLDTVLKSRLKKGQIILDDSNTRIDWSDDSNSYRHATIRFFYCRLSYVLKWRNGNRLEEEKTRDVMYGAPLNSKTNENEYRYWFESPQYFNEDLKDYYNFIGWYYTPYYYRQVDKNTAKMPANDVTLYARWDPKIINVSFYPTYNDYYSGTNKINGEIPVHYGDYMETHDIPADVTEDPEELRPDLIPPTKDAMFAGWYYLRDNVPVRFDPENVPVTALNNEASLSTGARLRLYAEWTTKDAAKYKVTYVEKDNPDVEVASPTTGRTFVWKTRTFDAKGGSELNADHEWTEDGINWWPTVKSHSMLIRANSQGKEYDPNTHTFEYIQKRGVYYRVQYLDAASRTPLLNPEDIDKDEVYSTHGSIKEDAPFIPGYTAEKMSQSIVLTASTESTSAAQKAEELENNVITFYYNKNDKDYIYEVEYYKQNINDDGYTHYLTENMEIKIADNPETQAVEPTQLHLADLFSERVPQLIVSDGFTRVANGAKVTVKTAGGTETTSTVADNADIEITGNTKTTIKLYFNRNTYNYRYQYVDYRAEQQFNEKADAGEDVTGVWNGIMETFDTNTPQRVGTTVTIPAPSDYAYDNGTPSDNTDDVPYTRISQSDVTLEIAPSHAENPDVNFIKVYYRKFSERELSYKLVCQNEDDPYTDVDYDETKNPPQPLFGGLSMTLQTVDDYSKIGDVTFYDFNEATDSNGDDIHQHKYTFLGWYDNPEGTGTPLTTNAKLTKTDLGLEEDTLPDSDTTYYAVVRQDMVRANFEFRVVDEALPFGGEPDPVTGKTPKDLEAAEIVRTAQSDPDGNIVGRYFLFSEPFQYDNGTPLPYDKNLGYTVDILPKENDNRVYKYEFSEWWEENLNNVDGEGNAELIRKKNWNQTDSAWAIDSLLSQLDRKEDKHVIAVFKRREITEMPYTINYKYTDRQGVERTLVKKGSLTESQLNENNPDGAVSDAGCFELSDEFILSLAPYESNHGETLTWTDDPNFVEKTSIKGNPDSENPDEQVDRMTVTIYAKQETKKAYVHYRLNPTGEYLDPIETYIGANRNLDKKLEAIDMRNNIPEGKEFSHWEVKKTPSGNTVARCSDPCFALCIMDDYWISPVFKDTASTTKTAKLDPRILTRDNEDWLAWTWNEGEEGTLISPDSELNFTGLKNKVKFLRLPKGVSNLGENWANVWNETGDLDVQDGHVFSLTRYGEYGKAMYGVWAGITLTHLDYTRNQWTDESEEPADPKTGSTDLLYTDFEIAFNHGGNNIFGADSGFRTGVLIEICGTLPANKTFDPDKDYKAVTNYDGLVSAIKGQSEANFTTDYTYKTGRTRNVICVNIPTEHLTDYNRIEFGLPFTNAYKDDGTHTNSRYLMKITTYIRDKGDDGVFSSDDNIVFSNSKYNCLDEISKKELAIHGEDGIICEGI